MLINVHVVLIVPVCRLGREGELKAAGKRVISLPLAGAGAAEAGPGVERILSWRLARTCRTSSVTLAGSVTSSYQGHGLSVVHPHPGEDLSSHSLSQGTLRRPHLISLALRTGSGTPR